MTRFNGPTKTFLFAALLLALGLGTSGSGVAMADDALNMVPSSSLFCVRINNLDQALGRVELFLAGVYPAPVSMLVKGQLGQVLTGGAGQPQGLNTAGSFTVFGPLPGGAGPDPTAIGILIPVSDYQQFVSGNANVSAADGMGISTIGMGGSAMLEVTQVGSFALAGKPGSGLAEAKKLLEGGATGLAAGLDAAEGKKASTSSIWAYANIEAVAQIFGPMVQAKIAEIKQGLAMAAQQGASQMAAASASIDMYATLIETLLNEAKYLSLSLDPSGDKLGAAVVLAGKPGSSLAAMFQAGPAQAGNKLLGYLDNGAIMNFAGSLDSPFWKKYNEAALGMVSKMMGGGNPDANMDELKTMLANATECFSGSIAGSFSAHPGAQPPFSVQYVAGLKDAEKFYDMMDAASKMMTSGSIAEMYKNMGMTVSFDVKRKADTYQGVPIDSVTFSMKSTDADSPQGQIINKMYGDGFNVHLATLDGMLVYALSPEPGATVRKLIDQVKAGGSGQAPSEVQTAMGLIPGADKADFFTTFNVLRFMQMVSAFAPVPLPAANVPSQSSLAIAGGTADGKMTIELAAPKQHVVEIMGAVMQMQMQQQQSMQQQGM
jgi:hypothetical protein